MKQSLLLILCLLATFKGFSQNDTKPYVILTEKQAKSVIKDIIHMDALEETNLALEMRISNLLKKGEIYEQVITTKDTIIGNKDKIIALKDKMLDAKKSIEFHSYIGGRTYNIDIANPIFYFRSQFEFKKWNVGAQINLQPAVPNSTIDGFNYNLFLEYKLF